MTNIKGVNEANNKHLNEQVVFARVTQAFDQLREFVESSSKPHRKQEEKFEDKNVFA